MSDQNKFSAPAAPPSTAGNGGANNISLLSSLMESPESRASNKRTIKATRKFDEQQIISSNSKRQPKPRKILDASEILEAEEEKVPANVLDKDSGNQLVRPLYIFIEEEEEDEEGVLEDEAEEEDDGDEDEDDDEEEEEDDEEEDANGQPKKSGKSSGKKRKSKATSRKLWNQTVSITRYA